MTIETRLAELGITLPDAPAPAANYVPFVRTGNQVYISGQISRNGATLLTGKLGLDAVAQRVLDQNVDVQPVSGRQERIENLLNSYI